MGDEKRSDTEKEQKSGLPQIQVMHVIIAVAVIVLAVIFIAKFGFGTDLINPVASEMSLVQQKHPAVSAVATQNIVPRSARTILPAPSVTTTTQGPDVSSDPKNCGTTGNVCPAVRFAYSTCLGGKCSFTCKINYDDCNKNPADGCEVYLGAADNCGACGNVCEFPQGWGECSNSQCVLERCNDGWSDCNGKPSDGCEVYVWSNTNCGSCGHKCDTGKYCVRGVCQIDCPRPNTISQDGLRCVDTQIDTKNCGYLNHVCLDYPNAVGYCENGQCTYNCVNSQLWGDCDKIASNGCESSLLTDNNCGACGNKCGWNGHCSLFDDTTVGVCFGTIF